MLATKVKTKIKMIFQVIVLTENCTKCIYTYIERDRGKVPIIPLCLERNTDNLSSFYHVQCT